MRILVLVGLAFLFSCASSQQERMTGMQGLMEDLYTKGIDPCRVIPCAYTGKTRVEVVDVPAEDRGDFIIYPHKEVVTVKPVDLLDSDQKVRGKCRQ